MERSSRIDWGQLGATALLAGIACLYLWDARTTSLDIQNLLFVQPTALFILACSLPVFYRCLRPIGGIPKRARTTWRLPVLMASFGAFAILLEKAGIDAATILFVFVATWLCGEKRLIPLLIFTALFSSFIIWGMVTLIPYRIPMLFF